MPVHPEWYSDEFRRLLRRADLRRITLHDSRHTTLTLMEHAGVPISIVSKWAGHYDAAFTQRTYVHASSPDLDQGRRDLARVLKERYPAEQATENYLDQLRTVVGNLARKR
jgi:integrase